MYFSTRQTFRRVDLEIDDCDSLTDSRRHQVSHDIMSVVEIVPLLNCLTCRPEIKFFQRRKTRGVRAAGLSFFKNISHDLLQTFANEAA